MSFFGQASPSLVLLLVSSAAFAHPDAGPPNTPFRTGANHHTGDDSFVEKFGRKPRASDDEHLRMRVHFEHIHAMLSKRPATKPELAAKRAELLGYLAEYTKKGITPQNDHVPWRTPVFIDDAGTICAVGYLIARSEGRQVSEKIAANHRYDYLDDIAKAMPEISAWVEKSGFTLDELASIQPGYSEPEANTWQRWFASMIPDGAYEVADSILETPSRGRFKNHRMQGTWEALERVDQKEDQGEPEREPKVLGSGEMRNGNGAWTSYYPDGKKLAEGPFASNDPNGKWKFFHPSGNLAAIGNFRGGTRTGPWKFFHDSAKQTPIAVGRFSARGEVAGRWRHFDEDGKVIAVSHEETPSSFKMKNSGPNNGDGEVLEITPGKDGVRHSLSVVTLDGAPNRLDTFALGRERIYVHESMMFNGERLYDQSGHKLQKLGDAYVSSDCKWAPKRRQIAATGDVAALHGLLFREARGKDHDEALDCGAKIRLDDARSQRIDALLASRDLVRAQSPQFVRDIVLSDRSEQIKPEQADMVRLIAANMTWYVEWPHIDGKFVEVFHTLPGHVVRHWYDDMMKGGADPTASK